MELRTVNVEILREGPRHNQLLSPLTQYLAVCGDSPAARLMLPDNYEQASFERRISELRYDVVSEDPSRLSGVLDETGTEIGKVLGSIPGLAGALFSGCAGGEELIHLRLILSASELSRIPWELSKVPAGAGASPDEWLSLHRPICVTRRDRSVPPNRGRWGKNPQILFVAGPDVEEVFDEHLEALTDVLKPWSACPTERGPSDTSPPWLVILKDATLDAVKEAMKSRPTFVHILAHGDDDFEDEYGRFGVALKGETVSGARLASTLATVGDDRQHLPTVVTLATCDSANEASPIPPDASVAHALHARGIPLVIASQFPLSVEGSVPFVKLLYEDLLRGRHPLRSLYRLRLSLHAAQSSFHHDWGAITAYEALPDDLEEQLDELRYWQSRRAHESSLRRVEGLAPPRDSSGESAEWEPPGEKEYQRLVDAVDEQAGKLPDMGPYAIEAIGLRAAGWKRLAEVDCRLASRVVADSPLGNLFESCARLFRRSLDEYRTAVDALLGSGGETVNKKVSLHWMLTQVVSTSLILCPPESNSGRHDSGQGWASFGDYEDSLWTTSRLSAEVDRNTHVGGDRAWGHVSLTELWLLRVGDDSLSPGERAKAAEKALDNARQIVAIMGRDAEQTVNTRRQIERYAEWWGSEEFAGSMGEYGMRSGATWQDEGGLVGTARKIVSILSGGRQPVNLHPDCVGESNGREGDEAPLGKGTAADNAEDDE